MGILKLKRLLKNIAQGRKGGGGGSSALDRDFRRIIRQIPLGDKRDLILQYGDEVSKRRAHNTNEDGKPGDAGTKFRSPQEFAEEVAFWTEDFPAPAAVVPLREALERGSSRWLGAFRDADGVSSLCGVMEALAESRDLHLEEGDSINPQEVPAEEIGAEEEVVKCLMVLFNKEAGLSTLEGSANLWPVIVRGAMDSSSESVRLSLLKVLTVMLETGEDGLKAVLNALDVVKAQKNNDHRFSTLVDALSPATTTRGGEEPPPQESNSHDDNGDGGRAASETHRTGAARGALEQDQDRDKGDDLRGDRGAGEGGSAEGLHPRRLPG